MFTGARTKVLIAHLNPLVTSGLLATLQPQPDMSVMVQDCADDVRSFDVVITDYQGGLATAAQSTCGGNRNRGGRALILTNLQRERDVRLALESGVHGYQLLGCTTHDLLESVRTVARGTRYLCPVVAHCLADSLMHEALTLREADVLHLLAKGHGNKLIAKELDIAVGTVKTHVKAILAKLEAKSRTAAAAVATERGLVDPLHGHTRTARAQSSISRWVGVGAEAQ